MTLIRILWVGLAGLSFSIGVLGIFLPLLPTTVFMLMAVSAPPEVRRASRFGSAPATMSAPYWLTGNKSAPYPSALRFLPFAR